MTRQRPVADWKMVLGFGGLLFLITAIGLIGIRQIQGLSKVVSHLARVDVPLQNAVLEMKSSNSKYAMGIRSYMFWRSAKYLEAAAEATKLNTIHGALESFDSRVAFCESLATGTKQKEWIQTVRASQKNLRSIGEEIIRLTDRLESSPPDEKNKLNDLISLSLMEFESRLFRLDAFLDDPLGRYYLGEIDRQLSDAETGKRRSITFLGWSLCIGLGLGAQTAYLIYRRSKREKERLELLWRRMVSIEEEERNNLSLQIHDQMGQDLSALKIFLGLIGRDLSAQAQDQRERIEKAKKILDVLMNKAHNISELLRPPELDDLGLVESIAALILQYKEMTALRYNYSKPSQEVKLSPESSLVLYRVVQEALTNITKHSNAKNVDIFLESKADAVHLSVSDDGIGFDYMEYLRHPQRRREDKVKLGLAGLRERIELLGGKLTVDTKPGQGSRLEVMLPVA